MSLHKYPLSVDQINILIDHVSKFPCLWDPEHKNYSQRNAVTCAWIEIAIKMDLRMREKMLRMKWKNLRDLFVRETKRLQVKSINEYRGKWKFYKKLHFIFHTVVGETDSRSKKADCSDVCYVELKPEPDNSEYIIFDQQPGMEDRTSQKSDSHKQEGVLNAPTWLQQGYTVEDCDMMFLISLAPYFRLLTPARKLAVQSNFQEILLKEINLGDK